MHCKLFNVLLSSGESDFVGNISFRGGLYILNLKQCFVFEFSLCTVKKWICSCYDLIACG